MKKKVKFIFSLVLIFSLFYNINVCRASDSFMTDAGTWLSKGEKAASGTTISTNAASVLSSRLLGIGLGVAVIVGTIIGIKYMISSVEEKAQVKKLLIVYVIGVIVIFGAVTIWSAIVGSIERVV